MDKFNDITNCDFIIFIIKNMKTYLLIASIIIAIISYSQNIYPEIKGIQAGAEIETALKSVNDSFKLYTGYPVIGSFNIYSPKAGGVILNMDSDPDEEIVFGCGTKLYALNIDGTNVQGWPVSFPANYEVAWAPSAGDIDGDGEDEIVVTAGGSTGGNLYAFEKDGSYSSGFPVTFGKFPLGTVLYDINNDGVDEIIIGKYNYPGGLMYVYKGDGSVFPGWPYDMGEYPASFAAVGDINNDNIPEIIGESRNRVWAWDTAGNVIAGWPFVLDDTSSTIINSYSSPVIADIDLDGDMEIIFCAHDPQGYVFVLNNDGSLYPGFPQVMDNWIYATPMIADINGDNYPEIIAADQAASPTPANYMHVYDRFGNDISGFPVGPVFGIYNQPVIANIDSDYQWEIITDANIQNGMEGYYYCYDYDGSENSEWPLTITGNSYFQQMLMADINHDDTLDIFASGIDLNTGDVYMQLFKTNIPYYPEIALNPVYQFNNKHTGAHPIYGPANAKQINNNINEVNIYPVPATEKLIIKINSNNYKNIDFDIFNNNGKNIKQKNFISYKLIGNLIEIDISSLPAGIYHVKINSNQKIIANKTFVKI
ncbi:MAG: hypothetical protein Kow0068_24160 [Marinilabiliales bacterium]